MAPKLTTGEADFPCPAAGKPCKTWYAIYGDISSSSTGRPLVILHGGPGFCHNYMLPVKALADSSTYNIPVIFYDQLGCGNSTHIREKRLDTSFWTPELYMAELDNLLRHLGIEKDYDLLGQSWGGMFGSMWALNTEYESVKGMKRLIISNSPASMMLWVESCNGLRKGLPRDVNETLEKHEKDQTYDDPEYEAAVEVWNKKHMCRVFPFPEDLMDSIKKVKADDTVYFTMNGPSEFTVIGSLKNWSVVDEVHKIQVPTLLINGEFDEAQNICVAPFFRNIPKVKWITMSDASHCSNLEQPEKYMQIVADFLKTT